MNVQIVPPHSNKNYAIEAFRFIFICIICLWHCRDAAPWLRHGYIAVEFYFCPFWIFYIPVISKAPELRSLRLYMEEDKKVLYTILYFRDIVDGIG